MTVTAVATDTQTAVLSTPHTLETQTANKTYVLCVDLAEMDSGDVVVLEAFTKVTSGGLSALSHTEQFSGTQAQSSFISIPIPSVHEIVFVLTQTAGTARDFPWTLLTLD